MRLEISNSKTLPQKHLFCFYVDFLLPVSVVPSIVRRSEKDRISKIKRDLGSLVKNEKYPCI